MFVSPFFELTPKKVRKIRKMGHVKIPYQKNFRDPKPLIPAARAEKRLQLNRKSDTKVQKMKKYGKVHISITITKGFAVAF